MEELSLEELELGFLRLQAAQQCRDLMGRYAFLHTRHRHKDYVALWADRSDCVLEMPWGKYAGKAGVETCYLVDHGDAGDPEYLARKRGEMAMHTMDTAVVEVAADGKTARGVWMNPGHETYPDEDDGQVHCEWTWGKYAVDFILEDGVWKFWHMRLYPIFKTDFSRCWCEPGQPDTEELADFFGFFNSKPYAEPLWSYSPEAVYPASEPEPPLPYEAFEPPIAAGQAAAGAPLDMARVRALCEHTEAHQAAENLMGKFCFLRSAGQAEALTALWSRREDCRAEAPWGVYEGRQAVSDCFLRDMAENEGAGSVCRHLNSPVIVVADDGGSARGIWISPGHEYADGTAFWAWNRFAADFIYEDGAWRIWKMRLYPTFRCPYDTPWKDWPQTAYREHPARYATREGESCWVWSAGENIPLDQPEVVGGFASRDCLDIPL